MPTPADRTWTDELLARSSYRGCDYNFANPYAWSRVYNQRATRVDDFLMTHVCGCLGCSYMYPVGSGDIVTVIRALEVDAARREEPLRLACLTPRQMIELEESFPGRSAYTADQNGYDYLYEVERLAELGGKKLHAKYNHVNHFVENNPTWTYEEITSATLSEYLEMGKERHRRSLQRGGDAEGRDLGDEGIALRTVMEYYEELGLEGSLVRVYGEVVAFTISDRLFAGTYDVHFEKAYSRLQGAYAMINREFARWARVHRPETRYLNWEGDMDVESLRKAKQSYYPNLMVEEHAAVMRWQSLKRQERGSSCWRCIPTVRRGL